MTRGAAALLAAVMIVSPGSAQAPVPIAVVGSLTQGGLATGVAPPGTVRLTLDGRRVALAVDRGFLVGFDRDAGAAATLVATLVDGSTVVQTLAVSPRAWRIERLDRLARVPQPDTEFARRRPAELARIAAARALNGTAAGWRQRFRWPASGRISGLFGAQRLYRGEPGAFHSGVDVAQGEGTPVAAPADGVVVLAAADPFTLEGRLLIVDHGHGLNSAFLHLSRIDVAEGDRVTQGQLLGAIGRTGRATGPHLHWSLKWNDARLDPMLVAGAMPATS